MMANWSQDIRVYLTFDGYEYKKAEKKPKKDLFEKVQKNALQKSIKYDSKYHFCSHFHVFMSFNPTSYSEQWCSICHVHIK